MGRIRCPSIQVPQISAQGSPSIALVKHIHYLGAYDWMTMYWVWHFSMWGGERVLKIKFLAL